MSDPNSSERGPGAILPAGAEKGGPRILPIERPAPSHPSGVKFLPVFLPPIGGALVWFAFGCLTLNEAVHTNAFRPNGMPDNTPYHAAQLVIGLTPFVYAGLLAIHGILLLLRRWTRRSVFLHYIAATICIPLLVALLSKPGGHWSEWALGLLTGVATAAALLLPSALGWWAITRLIARYESIVPARRRTGPVR